MKAIQAGAIDGRTFSPSATFRLKTHPDKNVAKLATDVFDALRGPVTKEKDTLVVKFQPTVDKPGDLANGKKLFEANCQGCHKFKGQGRDLAPDLTGMGVHGAHELLIHILDPNRVVEENFLAISIETKDGESYDGVVATENNVTVKLRNATTDLEIQKKNIKSRRSTGRSLMPEGFEALGARACAISSPSFRRPITNTGSWIWPAHSPRTAPRASTRARKPSGNPCISKSSAWRAPGNSVRHRLARQDTRRQQPRRVKGQEWSRRFLRAACRGEGAERDGVPDSSSGRHRGLGLAWRRR